MSAQCIVIGHICVFVAGGQVGGVRTLLQPARVQCLRLSERCFFIQIKSNEFISETADSKIEIQDNDNVQPLTGVRKGCCQC